MKRESGWRDEDVVHAGVVDERSVAVTTDVSKAAGEHTQCGRDTLAETLAEIGSCLQLGRR
jgi:hypothetical protein